MSFALLRYQRIWVIGCLACKSLGLHTNCEVHHLNGGGQAGQKRRGDMFTIGLCKWHHQAQPIGQWTSAECRERLGPSLKFESRAFREKFGDDDTLLAEQNSLLDRAMRKVVGRERA